MKISQASVHFCGLEDFHIHYPSELVENVQLLQAHQSTDSLQWVTLTSLHEAAPPMSKQETNNLTLSASSNLADRTPQPQGDFLVTAIMSTSFLNSHIYIFYAIAPNLLL